MVKLFNNLNTVQTIRVKDRSGLYYSVFIESKRSTEIEGYQVTDDILSKISNGSLLDLNNSLQFKKSDFPKVVEASDDEVNVIEETLDVSSEEETVETDDSQESDESFDVIESKDGIFVCDICGNEYASSKSLAMHKSRSHK